MAGTCIRLLVFVLCFSYLICKNGGIPFTRSRDLMTIMQKPGLEKLARSWKTDSTKRRMEIEVNDYPGSGANNRHTPRPQLGRGCIDC
ncbi:uncharacterized protein LOC105157100 [Sesamum indicum]|uniref:Uncharacterized protein LOC105157100 n=1 Tax=Sesamum indicum TaxID=4182 RepID=A0A6I9SNY6_SESIN|nr:uncharacterized protein LOC105157100 [Sesamum indicum]